MSEAKAGRILVKSDLANDIQKYRSYFQGHVSSARGGTCTVSWPGIYAAAWDRIVDEAKKDALSAAVVFLSEEVVGGGYGEHISDKDGGCTCEQLYGRRAEWGCKW
jgi:hypothetical protein